MAKSPVETTTLVTPTTDKPVLNLSKLDKPLRDQVQALNADLASELGIPGQSRIRLGEIIARGRDLLEPSGLFTAWINSTPIFSDTTAYRLIAEYEASKTFPVALLEVAAVSGIRIVGSSDDKPYGRYTDVVAKIGAPPRKATQETAAIWLQRVVHEYNQDRLAKRKAVLPLGDAVVFAQRWIVRLAGKVPQELRGEFLRDTIDKVVAELGISPFGPGPAPSPPRTRVAPRPRTYPAAAA